MTAFISTFFQNLGIQITSLDVREDDADIYVSLHTPDSPLLIGIHGKTLESFAHLLGRMIEKKMEKHIRLHLEINDYMKMKDEKFFRFLDTKIAMIQASGKSVQIAELSAYDRKKAHDYIASKNIPGLSTSSTGVGSDRVLALIFSTPVVASVSTGISENGTGI